MLYAQNDIGKAIITDTTSAEYWRKIGYEYRLIDKPDSSLFAYLRVLQIQRLDWDANLAVARLYFNAENYKTSLIYYRNIYDNDSTDVEALWGMGKCYFRLGDFGLSVKYFQIANLYLKNYIPLMLDYAAALTNFNKLKDAINVYQNIISFDSTHVDALAGLGKLHYWSGKPYSSRKYYQKALLLDPANAELKQQLEKVNRELGFTVNYQFHYVNENEPVSLGSDTLAYNINAIVQRVTVNRRIHDNFFLTFSCLADHSVREYAFQDTETRWFDNSYIKGTFIVRNHKVHLYTGYSLSEDKFSSYGTGWDFTRKFGKLKFSNALSAGYDYYYYWNKVGHDFISDQVRLEYKNFVLEGVYRFANVKELTLLEAPDTIGRNKGIVYTISGRYTVLKNPKISLGIYYQFRNYQYRSPLYWSPSDRKLLGINTGVYLKISEKSYFYGYGNIGKDNYDIQHWEASAEAGYNFKKFSLSCGVYRFYNPWYESLDAFISLTKQFFPKRNSL